MGQASPTQSSGKAPGGRAGRVALLWRGDSAAPPPDAAQTRLAPIFAALESLGLAAVAVIWAEAAAETVRSSLLACDGVLVWVDPLSEDADRSRLDPLLREIAAAGAWVSAHPDVILKMGTKEVLFRTRDFGWGADIDLYPTLADFRTRFPARLAAAGPRVLKQYRGNGGQGVWKVERLAGEGADPRVRILHARRGSAPEETSLAAFIDRCAAYFDGDGRLIDQAFQPRLPEGMIRCYLSGGRVVGYGQQLIKALIAPPPEGPDSEAAQPGPRIMHPPEAPSFQALRRRLETEWVPALQARLDIREQDLPALWDADFLYGPKTAAGDDTFVLCEINVSSVAPFPESAAAPVAETVLRGLSAIRSSR